MHLYFQIEFPDGTHSSGQAGSNTIKAPTEKWLLDFIVQDEVGKDAYLSSIGINRWKILNSKGKALGILQIGQTRFG